MMGGVDAKGRRRGRVKMLTVIQYPPAQLYRSNSTDIQPQSIFYKYYLVKVVIDSLHYYLFLGSSGLVTLGGHIQFSSPNVPY